MKKKKIICETCGRKNDPDQKFCPACGNLTKKTDGELNICVCCHSPLAHGSKICPNCGNEFGNAEDISKLSPTVSLDVIYDTSGKT